MFIKLRRFPLLILLLLHVLASCDHKPKNTKVTEIQDDLGHIIISDDITVDPSHIASIKPELYQPSLTLYGQLLPIESQFISYPEKLKLLNIAVKKNEFVQKDQTLMTAKSVLSIEQIASKNQNQTVTIKAPFSGTIQHLYYNQDKIFSNFYPTFVNANKSIMILINNENWQFISVLPKKNQSQLSVGQHVNFSVISNKSDINQVKNQLTGQISEIKDIANDNKKSISVNVHLISNNENNIPLRQGMHVQGKVDYGQLKTGTLISKIGVHQITNRDFVDGMSTDLSVFSKPHSHVVSPVKAYVWIVKHDRKLKKQIVDVIRYDEQSNRYFISGIPGESLICLVDLPESSEGKLLRVS